jgi:hypothetical protein
MGKESGVSGAEDFTRIAGIEQRIARRLHEAGVLTYADLATRSTDEIIRLLPDISGLSPARVGTWRSRAQELAATVTGTGNQIAESVGDGQHYESFIVRVLRDVDGSIRSTTIQHVRTAEMMRWAAWEREALLDFVEMRAAATLSQRPAEAPARAGGEPGPMAAVGEPAASASEPTASEPTAGGPAAGEPSRAVPQQALTPVITLGLERPLLQAAERFTVAMQLDLREAGVRAGRIAYHAVVVAKPLGGGPKRMVAQEDGLLPADKPTIRIHSEGLPAGIYRLDAAVRLHELGATGPAGLAAAAEGVVLEVLPR